MAKKSILTHGLPEYRTFHKVPHKGEPQISDLPESERHKILMRDVYDAQYKYKQGKIARWQRDDLIEEAEDKYDMIGR